MVDKRDSLAPLVSQVSFKPKLRLDPAERQDKSAQGIDSP
jgi:hypothetical protein